MMHKSRSTSEKISDKLYSMVTTEDELRKDKQTSSYIRWYRKLQWLGVAVASGGIFLVVFAWFTELRHVRQLSFFDPNFIISTAFGVMILYNILFNYLHCVLSDAGIYPKQSSDPNWLKILPKEVKPLCCEKSPPNPAQWTPCWICEHWRPPHTHHCSACNVCVLDMDHHCPWVGNCVGRNNIREYMLFLFWLSIGISYYLLYCLYNVGMLAFVKAMGKLFRLFSPGGGVAFAMAVHSSQGDVSKIHEHIWGFTHEDYERFFLFLTCFISIAGFIFVVILQYQQIGNIRKGQSSVEIHQNFTLQKHKKQFHNDVWTHPNRGFTANLCQVLKCEDPSGLLLSIFPRQFTLPSFRKRRDQSKAF